PAELLVCAPGSALQFENLRAYRRELAADGHQRDAPAHFGLDRFRRFRRIGHVPEVLHAIEKTAIPSKATFGNPPASGQPVLPRNAILSVEELLIVRRVNGRSLRVWP